jgi:hypothetical protein
VSFVPATWRRQSKAKKLVFSLERRRWSERREEDGKKLKGRDV